MRSVDVRSASTRSYVAIAVCAALLGACSPSSSVTSEPGVGTATPYHLVQTGSTLSVVDSRGRTLVAVTQVRGGSVTKLADGRTENMSFADLGKSVMNLGDGYQIRFPNPEEAEYVGPSGQIVATATAVHGGVEISANGQSKFIAQSSIPGIRPQDECTVEEAAYALAIAAEVAGVVSLDPVAVAIALAAAELAAHGIQEACPQ